MTEPPADSERWSPATPLSGSKAAGVGLSPWLSPRGRISRGNYWLVYAGPILVLNVAAEVIDAAMGYPPVWWSPFALVGTLGLLVTAWPASVGTVKRLHDHDVSGWWIVAVWLAFFGVQVSPLSTPGQITRTVSALFFIGVVYVVAFKPGPRQSNRFGPAAG